MISVFDLFKIGIGPSSSHTVGPMRAAKAFADGLVGERFKRVEVRLYGSLAWTGKGHGTDRAVILGLAGLVPDLVDPDEARMLAEAVEADQLLAVADRIIEFDPARDLVFDFDTPTEGHPNTMRFAAFAADGRTLAEETWYSIGGGFVVRAGEDLVGAADEAPLPFPYRSGDQLLAMGQRSGQTIAAMVWANERAQRRAEAVTAHLDRIAETMFQCIERGMRHDGELPGGLKVKRRARPFAERLEQDRRANHRMPHEVMDWVSLFAMAVNEENAAGGRVVTAPTNGAAGVVPAVLRYYRDFCEGANEEGIHAFLLTAAAIGGLFKLNASISGAEVGCQGEVGVACSMAAAGLAAALGGTNEQIENAAEIGMEHHLGMTCDPIGGLVQIPCIERNAFGAIKAINAASMALKGDGTHRVSLDQVIATMHQTGKDMASKYKETSLGGLAVNVPEC